MEENMQLICNRLLAMLQATRGGRNVVNLIYTVGQNMETVTLVFLSCSQHTINVTGDSGITMVYDIMDCLRR